MKHKIVLSLISAMLLISGKMSFAATKTSTGAGNWTSSSSWSPSGVPSAGDVVNIQTGHVITVTTNVNLSSGSATNVNVSGNLQFDGGGAKLRLSSGSAVTLASGGLLSSTGGSGSSSQQLQMGTTAVWGGSMGNFTGPRVVDEVSPLPVKWLTINAKRTSINEITISWSTSAEMSNSHFEVERTTDGVNFVSLHQMNGQGTTQKITEYSWVDEAAPQGMVYYRLKQVDFNGDFEYSNLMVVTPATENIEGVVVTAFPNPVTEVLNIDFSAETPQQMDITFVDLFGNEVKKIVIEKGRQSARLDVRGLKKGYYFLIIRTQDIQKSQRVLVN